VKLRKIHVVYATWCPHCNPTTIEPMKKLAKKLGIECALYDIDDPAREKIADELVRKYGDWCEDYIIPQVFFEYDDGTIEHVLTGFSEGVEFTKRAVENLLKSAFLKKLVAE
jgi:thiol-disulfide isomerase/thioredoxin